MMRWPLALLGLALATFAVIALTGPGRIDIEDGQARFEAGRNLIDHGDTALRDPRIFWNKFPGRDGREYTDYRLPQIVVAAGCVAVSDFTGERSEGRRHFLFDLHGAVCAALLAVLLAIWFRSRGESERAALGWAAAGIFATPCWYYATSTFDEILTSLVAVLLLVSAAASRRRFAWLIVSAVAAGLLFNCKQPMLALALPAVALACDPKSPRSAQWLRASVVSVGAVAGWLVLHAYDRYKFPPEARGDYERIIREEHLPNFFGNVPEALLDMVIGPSSGAIWYFPPILLVAAGIFVLRRGAGRRVAIAYLIAAAVIVGFVSLLTFYKGGVCWGPRYLTPLFAAGWLFVPVGARRLGPALTRILLILGVVVQLLALAAIPERLYVQRELPTAFYMEQPWYYFHPALGHIVNRPREVAEILTAEPSPCITPSPSLTFTLPIFHPDYFPEPQGNAALAKYQILNGPRFWWAWMSYASQPPIDIARTAELLGIIGILGGAILLCCWPRHPLDQNKRDADPEHEPQIQEI